MTPRGAARGTGPQSFGHFSVTGRTSRGPLLARAHPLYTGRLRSAYGQSASVISPDSRIRDWRSVRGEKGRKRGRKPIGVRSPSEGDQSTEGNRRSRPESTPRHLVPPCLPKPAPFSVPVPAGSRALRRATQRALRQVLLAGFELDVQFEPLARPAADRDTGPSAR